MFSILTTLLILWLTLAANPLGDTELPLFPGADKLAHAAMFGFLVAMICLDLWRRFKRLRISWVWWSALYSAALGLLCEVLQRCMHLGRTFEWEDFGADAAGAALFALAITIYLRKKGP